MKKRNKQEKLNTYLDHLYELDYKERPVSMTEFICSDTFLGKLTGQGKMIYLIWQETLVDVSRRDDKYLVVLTGAIGTGKTTTAIIGILYIMHRILCLKDPWDYFHKAGGGKMAIIFFSLKLSLSESKGFNLLHSYLLKSPWFLDRGRLAGTINPRVEFPIFEYKLASPYAQGFGTISEDIIAALMDEVDSPIVSDKQRIRILKAFESAERRFDTRFVFDGESLGKLFLVASKQEELSFLNTFIIKMQNSKKVYIKDIALWEAKPESDYCGEKFPVMIGDVYTPSEVLGSVSNDKFEVDNKKFEESQRQGFQIIKVPIEYLENFQTDITGALRDLAGISVSYLRKSKLFSSENLLTNCYDETKKDPVKQMTIEIGLKDDIDLIKFLDLNLIRIPRNVPRFIHVDISFAHDALGIAMSCIKGWTEVNRLKDEGIFALEKLPVVETDFVMRIKAKPGDEIPLHKIRKLILDLKKIYRFNIVLCTFDLRLASADSMQILSRSGIKCESLSLDKDPQLYRSFVGIVEEERWVCHKNEYLHFELSNLNDDPIKNKVDHPDEVPEIIFLKDGSTQEVVLMGSKDMADATVGSVMKALEKCELPPDVEIMKKLISNATTSILPEGMDKLSVINQKLLGLEKKDSPQKTAKKDIEGLKDLFKRAKNA